MPNGQFLISLDFELLWGVRDKRTIESYGANLRGVREVVPALLGLFERYGIKATFATVGFLFARNREELLAYVPRDLPWYRHSRYSPYENGYLLGIGASEDEDVYHYAASLIDVIRQSDGQEIASHTFSHYYCLEGASLDSFRADMTAARAIAADHGVDLKSIIFPRNQYSPAHIQICKDLGFIAYRGNEASRLYNPRTNEEQDKVIRATRLADAYLNLTGHHTFQPQKEEGMVNLPASRFLRPYASRLAPLDGLRLQRIKAGMTHAARKGEAFHLWWHPHNFGSHLQENLSFLEAILQHYQQLLHRYNMQSKTMRAVAEQILEPYAV